MAETKKPALNTENLKTSDDVKTQEKTSNYILDPNPKYNNTHTLDSSQTNPAEIKSINFKQDYVVIIRKKPYYAATAQQRYEFESDGVTLKKDANGNFIPLKDPNGNVMLPEENYLRVYQINSFTNIRVSTSVYGKRPGSCSVTIRGGERVVCAEKKDQDKYGWQSWDEMLNGWLSINESATEAAYSNSITNGEYVAGVTERVAEIKRNYNLSDSDVLKMASSSAGKKWTVGEAHWALQGAAGVDFKSLAKTREAKYGWRFAEKADWEPMDEIWIFGKSRTARVGQEEPDNDKRDANGILSAYSSKSTGEFKFLPIFFGYIDSVNKTFTANKGGLLISISASDHLKLLELSRVVNSPTLVPGIASNGGIDIRYNTDAFGLFDLNQPLAGAKTGDALTDLQKKGELKKYQLANIFGGMYPKDIIQILGVQASIPEKYLKKRIEDIKEIPFAYKVKQGSNGDIFNGEMKSRLGICNEAAEKMFVEFFADEEGNIVLKIPNYALGANRLPANNMGINYPKTLLDDVYGTFKIETEGNESYLTAVEKKDNSTATVSTDASAASNKDNAGEIENKSEVGALGVEEMPQIEEITIDEWGQGEHGSLYDVAKKYLGDGSRWIEVAEFNDISDPSTVKAGDKILVHINADTTGSSSTTTSNAKAKKKPSIGQMILKPFDEIAKGLSGASKAIDESAKPSIPKPATTTIPDAKKNTSGQTISEKTDIDIPAIKSEFIISFTLIDSDKEIYNMFEVGGEGLQGLMKAGEGQVMTQIRRAIPDIDSIIRFGMRPHPGVVNTPLISNVFEAEMMGIMMLMRSNANRYSGSLTVIDDSAVKVGNPIRVHLYDEHPMKEIKINRKDPNSAYRFDKKLFPEQAVFYVTGIERNIDPSNASYMTLQLKAGRMMGQTSIYDICMPLYKFYYDTFIATDITKSLQPFQTYYDRNKSETEGHYQKYVIQANDSFDVLVMKEYGGSILKDEKKRRELFFAMVALNPDIFGLAAQFSNSKQIDSAMSANIGKEILIPTSLQDTIAQMQSANSLN